MNLVVEVSLLQTSACSYHEIEENVRAHVHQHGIIPISTLLPGKR